MRTLQICIAILIGTGAGTTTPWFSGDELWNVLRNLISPTNASPLPPEYASFDYGGVCRANTGVGETLPSELNLAHDEEWTVSIWVRNFETVRETPVACVFWGDNADSVSVGHILGIFVYFNEAGTDEHGNLVAWVHGRQYVISDVSDPLDDGKWHLLAVRNRNDSGVFRVALSCDGNPWESEAATPVTGVDDDTLPWSLNSMYDSRFGTPWVRRRDIKLDDLVVFDWALTDAEVSTLWNGGAIRRATTAQGLYSQMEGPGKTITYHLMFGEDGGSTTTTHKSYTDLNDTTLEFDVEGAGAGVIDTADYPAG